MREFDGLVVVVRTYNFKTDAVVHKPPAALKFSNLSRCVIDALVRLVRQFLMVAYGRRSIRLASGR